MNKQENIIAIIISFVVLSIFTAIMGWCIDESMYLHSACLYMGIALGVLIGNGINANN